MKFDCSKAEDFVHESARMCDSYVGCSDCAFNSTRGCRVSVAPREEDIAELQKWSDSNPMTKLERLIEILEKTEFDGLLMYEDRPDGSRVMYINKPFDWWNEEAE